jgi:AraC-like DNA-binding protein
MQTGPRFAETEGPLHLLGARLTLPAATALFGPLGRLGSPTPIPLDAALGAEAEALRERLCLAGSDRQALALLADWLLDRLSGLSPLALPSPRQLAVLGWRAEGLSDLLALSPRGLRKRFHECFGIAPKLWLQLSRFDAVLASRPQPGSLADTAAAFGYADQAHMTLEFGRFAGISPGRYAAVRARTAAPALAPHFVPGR